MSENKGNIVTRYVAGFEETCVNNFSRVSELMKFESEDDFYYLQITMRRKENPDLSKNSITIKEYYINSLDYLWSKEEEIVNMCEFFNARACINLNRRNYTKVAFVMNKLVADYMFQGDFESIRNAYSSACGKYKGNDNIWLIDIDEKLDDESIREMMDFINSLQPVGDKIIDLIPSRAGYHLTTSPFRKDKFIEKYTEYSFDDIKTNSPTNIYIP